jgi:hypothetical protein
MEFRPSLDIYELLKLCFLFVEAKDKIILLIISNHFSIVFGNILPGTIIYSFYIQINVGLSKVKKGLR